MITETYTPEWLHYPSTINADTPYSRALAEKVQDVLDANLVNTKGQKWELAKTVYIVRDGSYIRAKFDMQGDVLAARGETRFSP